MIIVIAPRNRIVYQGVLTVEPPDHIGKLCLQS